MTPNEFASVAGKGLRDAGPSLFPASGGWHSDPAATDPREDEGAGTSGERVTILMAVRDGEDFLAEQLESIARQTHENWRLIAADDASTDSSLAILRDFRAAGHDVEILHATSANASDNFMSLIRRAAGAGWIAFSDQDDVWLPDRIRRGLVALRDRGERPAFHCSRTWVFGESLDRPYRSRGIKRPPAFRNALVQNIAAGNTILLNPAASALATEAACEAGSVVAHDWWLYQLITGAGGDVIFDDVPTISYRQHARNQFGANKTRRSRVLRLMRLLRGQLREWDDVNVAALSRSAHRLTRENAQLLSQFAAMRQMSPFRRLRAFARLGVHRQLAADTAALWLAVLLRRI